nr:hypothetical protein [Tanacetum cinerariifolium]
MISGSAIIIGLGQWVESYTKPNDEMILCTIKGKPLVLSWGRTPRLVSGVRVSFHVLLENVREALDTVCNMFQISEEVHLVLPNQDDTMHERPAGKIGLYTRVFDFANFRLPLSTFLVDILRHFRINISQLSVIGAAKVSHFEILYLFAFIHVPDPTKVRVVEREREVDELRPLDAIVGRTDPLLLVAPDRADSELEASIERLFDEGGSGTQTEQGDSARGEPDVDIRPVVRAADTIDEEAAPVRSRRLGKRKYVVMDAWGFPSF